MEISFDNALNYVELIFNRVKSLKTNSMLSMRYWMGSWSLSVMLWLLRRYFRFSFTMQPCWSNLFGLLLTCIVLSFGLVL